MEVVEASTEAVEASMETSGDFHVTNKSPPYHAGVTLWTVQFNLVHGHRQWALQPISSMDDTFASMDLNTLYFRGIGSEIYLHESICLQFVLSHGCKFLLATTKATPPPPIEVALYLYGSEHKKRGRFFGSLLKTSIEVNPTLCKYVFSHGS